MAELVPASFRDLVTRLHREPLRQDKLFELPRAKWFRPDPDGPDLGVDFRGARAGNPSGPAAGPHAQLAQNILLSYVAGGRILELNTVQAIGHRTIPPPCPDVSDVSYNADPFSGLRIEDALREYVAGSMLVAMFRQNHQLGGDLGGLAGGVIYDVSVGHDLGGIQRDKVRGFLDGMRAAGAVIEQLRAAIPRDFAAARDIHFPARISDSVTLSTTPGCSADEIERICELLIADHGFNVTIKVNPPMLGRRRLEHLLGDVLDYSELRVNPEATTNSITLGEGIQLCERLTRLAGKHNRRVGFKFTHLLEVVHRRDLFEPLGKTLRLTGQPLHAIAMTLAEEFRRKVGPHVSVSFSGGIDWANFAATVACGFVPVTACTDLLRSGGYGRLGRYLHTLVRQMRAVDAFSIDEYILRRYGQEAEARRRAAMELGVGAMEDELHPCAVHWAGLLNTSIVAERVRRNRRYRAERNRRASARIAARHGLPVSLLLGEGLPACPNAALFTCPLPAVSFEYHDWVVSSEGMHTGEPKRVFETGTDVELACFADFCNECGNCRTTGPEPGRPRAETPRFHGTIESWERAAPRDGYVIQEMPEGGWIRARLDGAVYQLAFVNQIQQFLYDDGVVEVLLTGWGHQPISVRARRTLETPHRIDMRIYHLLRYLRAGVLDKHEVNPINVQWMTQIRASAGPW